MTQDSTPRAILVSLAFHALAAGAVILVRPAARVVDVSSQVFAVEFETPPSERSPLPEVVRSEPSPEGAVASPAPRVAMASSVKPKPESPVRTTDAVGGALDEGHGPKEADAREAGPLPGATLLDLGIGTYWKEVALHGEPATERPPEDRPARAPSSSTNRILRDGLEDHDASLGLARASPLVAAARDAASPALAPDVGSATLDIEADAGGVVTGARVLSATSDVSAWNDVARELVKLMRARPLHVPRDSHGMHARLRIVAERTLPSGAKAPPVHYQTTPDGLPGLARGFDLSDLAARTSRVVRVQLLGEVPL